MLRKMIVIGAFAVLAGCGDPLADLDRVTELDLPADESAAAALPTAEETAREGFIGTQAATPTAAAKAAADLAGAPAPDAAQATAAVDADTAIVAQTSPGVAGPVVPAAAPERKGVLGLLRRALPKPAQTPESAAPVQGAPEAVAADADAVATAVATSQAATIDTPIVAELVPDDATQVAALAPKPDAPAVAAPEAVVPAKEPVRRGLFGRSNKSKKARTGADAREAAYGEVMPYGVIARSCEARGRPLGRKIEKANARGFALYDSKPGAGGARTWYLTGFGDGCPRQLTAANVQIAPASLYEQLRYGPSGKHFKAGATDAAYEGIKRKVCGARKGKPCGSKIARMDKTTFFVTAYERFGNSSRWVDVLVHDGDVIALSLKP